MVEIKVNIRSKKRIPAPVVRCPQCQRLKDGIEEYMFQPERLAELIGEYDRFFGSKEKIWQTKCK